MKMTIMQKEIKHRSELINDIAYHTYSAAKHIPTIAESALNQAITVLLIENEKCRHMQEKAFKEYPFIKNSCENTK